MLCSRENITLLSPSLDKLGVSETNLNNAVCLFRIFLVHFLTSSFSPVWQDTWTYRTEWDNWQFWSMCLSPWVYIFKILISFSVLGFDALLIKKSLRKCRVLGNRSTILIRCIFFQLFLILQAVWYWARNSRTPAELTTVAPLECMLRMTTKFKVSNSKFQFLSLKGFKGWKWIFISGESKATFMRTGWRRVFQCRLRRFLLFDIHFWFPPNVGF